MPSVASSIPPKTLSEWKSPKSRPEDINALILGVDRYNPHNVALLEDYLEVQMKNGHVDLFANLAILKLYQFNPTLSNPRVIIDILLLSLSSPASLSSQDYNLSLSLAFDRPPTALLLSQQAAMEDDDEDDHYGTSKEEKMKELNKIEPVLTKSWALLRECRFREFWKVWEEDQQDEGILLIRNSYLPHHPHLLTSLRSLISLTISQSFTSIPLSRLQKWLHFSSDSEVEQWANGVEGWSVVDGQVKVEGNGDNDVKAGVVREEVKMSQLTKLLAAAASA